MSHLIFFGRELNGDEEKLMKENGLKCKFLLKPVNGLQGKGIELI